MVRGTISELDPTGDVVIRTMTGELRRFPMSEVKYAGPAAGMQPVAPPGGDDTAHVIVRPDAAAGRRARRPLARRDAIRWTPAGLVF